MMKRSGLMFGGATALAALAVWVSVSRFISPAEAISVDSRALVTHSLGEIYRAYGLDAEEPTYDLIASVATGDALEQLYLARRDAVADTGLDTAVQTIHEVQVQELISRVTGGGEDTRIEVTASWRVIGTVGHATHQHVRGNGYRADLAYNAQQMLTDFDLLAIERDVSVPTDAPVPASSDSSIDG